ncbi:MAG: carboxy terminal-processing peptidase [Puniceicoccales bacterium]|nr:carboxy terminal-processing peptidase [Puniceicoccales bacterium]
MATAGHLAREGLRPSGSKQVLTLRLFLCFYLTCFQVCGEKDSLSSSFQDTSDAPRSLSQAPVQLELNAGIPESIEPCPWPPLRPSPNMREETLAMKRCLEEFHYAKKPLYQIPAEEILKNYFASMDSSRVLFLEPEIQQITQELAPKLHLFLQRGDLTKAFEIFDLYRRHLWECSTRILRDIPTLDIQSLSAEHYCPYRKEPPWPQDGATAEHLWRQRLIYEIQSEVLSLEGEFIPKPSLWGSPSRKAPQLHSKEEPGPRISLFWEALIHEKELPAATWLTRPDRLIPPRRPPWLDILRKTLQDLPEECSPPPAIVAKAKECIARHYKSFLNFYSGIEPCFVQELFLNSLAQLYDPHSSFLSKDTFEEFNTLLRNTLVGIGAWLHYHNGCTIEGLTPGGPAARSGLLHPGDRIVAVGEEGQEAIEITNMPSYRSVRLIRGAKGSRVHLTIEPAEGDAADRRIITLIRDTIPIESARASAKLLTLSDDPAAPLCIGYICLPSFYGPEEEDKASSGSSDDVRQLLKELKTQGARGLILDLRGNSGGLLEEAIVLAGLFIPEGPIVQVRDPEGQTQVWHSHTATPLWDRPTITLISKQSVSASEILAGALQDHCRSLIVGDKCTHGKGSVQALIPLERILGNWFSFKKEIMGATRITVNKWYRPSGKSIQLRGVVSDIPLPSFDEWLPIGESDLPHALAWDAIVPPKSGKALVSAERGQPFEQLLQRLRRQSESRQQTLPEFAVLDTRIRLFRRKLDQEEVSLDLSQRLRERREEARLQREIQSQIDGISAQPFFRSIPITLSSLSSSAASKKTYGEEEVIRASPSSKKEKSPGEEYDTHLREALRLMRDWIEGQNTALATAA